MTKRIAIYARCSTDEQATENQIHELRGVAERHGWTVAAVFDDNGVSGGVPREDRPAMKALLRAVARREVDMVAAWAVAGGSPGASWIAGPLAATGRRIARAGTGAGLLTRQAPDPPVARVRLRAEPGVVGRKAWHGSQWQAAG
jgi:hypothetical protein